MSIGLGKIVAFCLIMLAIPTALIGGPTWVGYQFGTLPALVGMCAGIVAFVLLMDYENADKDTPAVAAIVAMIIEVLPKG